MTCRRPALQPPAYPALTGRRRRVTSGWRDSRPARSDASPPLSTTSTAKSVKVVSRRASRQASSIGRFLRCGMMTVTAGAALRDACMAGKIEVLEKGEGAAIRLILLYKQCKLKCGIFNEGKLLAHLHQLDPRRCLQVRQQSAPSAGNTMPFAP